MGVKKETKNEKDGKKGERDVFNLGPKQYKQSQKRVMVSGSLWALLSLSYTVSFVVRGQRPRRGQ